MPSMSRSTIKWVVGCTVLALLLAGVGLLQLTARGRLRNWDAHRAKARQQPIPVRTVMISDEDFEQVVGGTAVTQAASEVSVTLFHGNLSIPDREVIKVSVAEGSTVDVGDNLIKFRDDLFAQAVKERETALELAEHEFREEVLKQAVKQRQAELQLAIEEVKSVERLQKQKAATNFELQEARMSQASAALAVAEAESDLVLKRYEAAASVAARELELRLAKDDLSKCQIASPIKGVVGEVAVAEGMRIAGVVKLATIYQLDPIHVKMDYPAEQLESLALDKSVEVVLDSYPGETFHGKIKRIPPLVSTETRTLPVIIEVPNKNHRIRAGITGFARMRLRKRGVQLPTAAIIRHDERAMVYRVEEQRARMHPVRTGPSGDQGMVEILAGVRPGDEIVLYGQDELGDNALVDTNWHGWANRH